jgi:hypothetical protein
MHPRIGLAREGILSEPKAATREVTMSLEIDVEKISEVLLADGWHKGSVVGDGRSSFGLDVYEFHEPDGPEQPDSRPNAVQEAKEGTEQHGARTGARWTESDGSRVFCPVTSILAVKYAAQKKTE